MNQLDALKQFTTVVADTGDFKHHIAAACAASAHYAIDPLTGEWGLRAIPDEDPASAYMAAMAEDLEQSEKADEQKAAEGFKAILVAFSDEEKALSANTQGFDSWRKRSPT